MPILDNISLRKSIADFECANKVSLCILHFISICVSEMIADCLARLGQSCWASHAGPVLTSRDRCSFCSQTSE